MAQKKLIDLKGSAPRKEVGVLFQGDMIRAHLEGQKTVTRRIMKGPVNDDPDCWILLAIEKDPCLITNAETNASKIFPGTYAEFEFDGIGEHYCNIKSRWQVGDLLYARETWARFAGEVPSDTDSVTYRYRADLPPEENSYSCSWPGKEKGVEAPWWARWKPAIHMPKEAARIWMKVTEVSASRVSHITNEDAIREGVLTLGDKYGTGSPHEIYKELWNSINNVPSAVLDENGKPYKYVTYPFDLESADKFASETYRGLPLHVVVDPCVWSIRYDVAPIIGNKEFFL